MAVNSAKGWVDSSVSDLLQQCMVNHHPRERRSFAMSSGGTIGRCLGPISGIAAGIPPRDAIARNAARNAAEGCGWLPAGDDAGLLSLSDLLRWALLTGRGNTAAGGGAASILRPALTDISGKVRAALAQ